MKKSTIPLAVVVGTNMSYGLDVLKSPPFTKTALIEVSKNPRNATNIVIFLLYFSRCVLRRYIWDLGVYILYHGK